MVATNNLRAQACGCSRFSRCTPTKSNVLKLWQSGTSLADKALHYLIFVSGGSNECQLILSCFDGAAVAALTLVFAMVAVTVAVVRSSVVSLALVVVVRETAWLLE